MNTTFTTLNNSLTAVSSGIREARPVSHAAAVCLLGTSIFFVHEGAASVLPAKLVAATTLAMVAAEWLQWTALGRLEKIGKSDSVRAWALRGQSLGIGALQVILYTLAVTAYAAAAGQNWSAGWALGGAVVIAAGFAALNFVAKYTSCERVSAERPVWPQPRPGKVAPTQPEPVGSDFDRDSVVELAARRLEAAATRDKVDWLNDAQASAERIRGRRRRAATA